MKPYVFLSGYLRRGDPHVEGGVIFAKSDAGAKLVAQDRRKHLCPVTLQGGRLREVESLEEAAKVLKDEGFTARSERRLVVLQVPVKAGPPYTELSDKKVELLAAFEDQGAVA